MQAMKRPKVLRNEQNQPLLGCGAQQRAALITIFGKESAYEFTFTYLGELLCCAVSRRYRNLCDCSHRLLSVHVTIMAGRVISSSISSRCSVPSSGRVTIKPTALSGSECGRLPSQKLAPRGRNACSKNEFFNNYLASH